jgi:hypothetical protein
MFLPDGLNGILPQHTMKPLLKTNKCVTNSVIQAIISLNKGKGLAKDFRSRPVRAKITGFVVCWR